MSDRPGDRRAWRDEAYVAAVGEIARATVDGSAADSAASIAYMAELYGVPENVVAREVEDEVLMLRPGLAREK